MLPPVRTWAAEARATLALGAPLVLTNVAQVAIGTTDTLLLSRLGPDALAAGTLGLNLFWAVFVFGIGLVTATQPMLAQTLGAKRHSVRAVRRITRQGLWLSLGVALVAGVFLWHSALILRALGQDPVLSEGAQTYLRAMLFGLFPALAFQTLRCFFAALERPRVPLGVTAVAVVLNAILGWALIFGHLGAPALGLTGAGLAAALANAFLFLALLGYALVDRHLRRYALIGRFWRIDRKNSRELLRIGIPMALSMGFEVTGINAAAFLCGLIGAQAIAAHAITLQVAAITFMVPMGLAQAATVRVGLAIGAGDVAGAGRSGWVALGLGVAFMTLTAVLLLLFPGVIAGLFLDQNDPAAQAVLPLATTLLMIAGAFQIADGAQVVSAGALRGLKDTRIPMYYVGFGYWAFAVPLSAVLAFSVGWGAPGVWIGLASGLAIVAMLMTWRWSRYGRLAAVA